MGQMKERPEQGQQQQTGPGEAFSQPGQEPGSKFPGALVKQGREHQDNGQTVGHALIPPSPAGKELSQGGVVQNGQGHQQAQGTLSVEPMLDKLRRLCDFHALNPGYRGEIRW